MKNIILITSFLLILTSCATSQSSDTKTNIPNTIAKNNATKTTYDQDIASTSSKIKGTEEFQSCMKEQANMCSNNAGNQVARKTKDPSFCRELSTPEQQSSCIFAVTMINAQEKNDASICDTLTDINYLKQCKIQIYRQEAISKKDLTLCNKINTTTGSTGTGSNVDTNMQTNQCVLQVIMSGTGTTEKDCEKITDTESMKMCSMMMKNRPRNIPSPSPISVSSQN